MLFDSYNYSYSKEKEGIMDNIYYNIIFFVLILFRINMLYQRFRHTMTSLERSGHIQGYPSSAVCGMPSIKPSSGILQALPPTERPQKKKKKKSNMTKRKSLVCDHTLPLLTPEKEVSSLSDSVLTQVKCVKSKAKKLQVISPGRLTELATPPPRQLNIPVSLQDKVSDKKKKLPLLVAIKPENERIERERFMRASFNYNPYFVYRGYAEEIEKYRDPSDKYIPQVVELSNILSNVCIYLWCVETIKLCIKIKQFIIRSLEPMFQQKFFNPPIYAIDYQN